MLRRPGHLLAAGSALVALGCASSGSSARAPEPSAVVAKAQPPCETSRLLVDTTLHAHLAQTAQLLADTARVAALQREAHRVLADTALFAELNARAQRLIVDTTTYTRMATVLADTAMQARVARLSQEVDSMLACVRREGGALRR